MNDYKGFDEAQDEATKVMPTESVNGEVADEQTGLMDWLKSNKLVVAGIGAAVIVVVLIIGLLAWGGGSGKPESKPSAKPSASATSTPSASPSPSASKKSDNGKEDDAKADDSGEVSGSSNGGPAQPPGCNGGSVRTGGAANGRYTGGGGAAAPAPAPAPVPEPKVQQPQVNRPEVNFQPPAQNCRPVCPEPVSYYEKEDGTFWTKWSDGVDRPSNGQGFDCPVVCD